MVAPSPVPEPEQLPEVMLRAGGQGFGQHQLRVPHNARVSDLTALVSVAVRRPASEFVLHRWLLGHGPLGDALPAAALVRDCIDGDTAPAIWIDTYKNWLTLRVNRFSKADRANRLVWTRYCDVNFEGMYDPSQREPAERESFLNTTGVGD